MPFNPPKHPPWTQMLARTVRWLGKTAAGLPEPKRRRSRVLAWMQITLIFLISVALVAMLLSEPREQHAERPVCFPDGRAADWFIGGIWPEPQGILWGIRPFDHHSVLSWARGVHF